MPATRRYGLELSTKNKITRSSFETDLVRSSDAEIINTALNKRKYLYELYKKNDTNINPLLLIRFL